MANRALVVASAIALTSCAPIEDQRAPRPWSPGEAPAWAAHVFGDELPSMGRLANAHDPRLAAVTAEATVSASPAPAIAAIVRELGQLFARPERNAAKIAAATDRLNDAAREAGVPLFADVQILDRVYVHTYRIEAVRTFAVDGERIETLWLSHADHARTLEPSLGWTRSRQRIAIVVLDSVEAQWLRRLEPALAGEKRTVSQRRYAKWAAMLAEDLDRAIDVDTTPAEALAKSVETHELQHAIDGDRVRIPHELAETMRDFPEEAIRAAASELSAYLAELARSNMPRLALIELAAIGDRYPQRPEGVVWRFLLEHFKSSEEILLSLPNSVLQSRARRAYQELFRTALAAPRLVDAR